MDPCNAPLADEKVRLTLPYCQGLRELEIEASYPTTAELSLISSISSTNIRKITFAQSAAFHALVVDLVNWTQLDNALCHLVDRSEYGLRLEVEFRVRDAASRDRELDPEKYLPKFHEKGRVRILDEESGMVVYYSDRAKYS
jgi:hypothetical protein